MRREGRSSVCLVLLRFESQLWADDFFSDFNGKPVSGGDEQQKRVSGCVFAW